MDKDKKEDENKEAGSSLEQCEKRRARDSVSSYSSVLDLEVKNAPKTAARFGKRNMRLPRKRNYRRVTGRVQKRKPKKMKRRPRPKHVLHVPSDTSFSSKHTLSFSRTTITCGYCGHRCCLRRYMEEKRRFNPRARSWKLRESRGRKKGRQLRKKTVSQICQMGAPSPMLSKLFVGCSAMCGSPKYFGNYKEILPEMIYQSLRDLGMWRHAISVEYIFEYINKNFPINPNENEAMEELLEKLHIAQLAGIAWALPNNCWRLTTALERVHRLDLTHVTIFWKAYWNTMKPLDKNRQKKVIQTDQKVTTEEEKATDDNELI